MNKIETIESFADTLARKSIAVQPKRCSYIRNWNSRCRSCLTACQHDAVKRAVGRLRIVQDACTECGACICACPTSTFVAAAPTATQIVKQARKLAADAQGNVAFACRPHANEYGIDEEKAVVLPCLNYLDEYLLCGLFSVGINGVVLVKGDCMDCPVDCSEPYLDVMVASTKNLLKLWNVPSHLKVMDEIPAELCSTRHRRNRNPLTSDRRSAFQQAGGSMMGALVNAVDDIVGSITGEPAQREDPNKRVTVHPDEVFPPDTYRSVRLLNMLDRIGTRPRGATIESRFWASVSVDSVRCKRCGNCATICPTNALAYTENEDGTVSLAFTPSLCMGCRMCKDCCTSRSMVYSTSVLADDLDSDVVKYLYDHIEPEKKHAHF